MNKSLSVDLMLYGGLLLGSSILAHRFCPDAAATTLWIGIGGGPLSALLGVLGLRGYAVRRWAILATTVLAIALFTQTVVSWSALKAEVNGAKSGTLIFTILWVFAVGQLLNLIQNRSGLPFDDEPEHRDRTRRDE